MKEKLMNAVKAAAAKTKAATVAWCEKHLANPIANQEVVKWGVGLAVSLVVLIICAIAQAVL